MNDILYRVRNLRIWIFALAGGILFAAFDRCGYMLKSYGSIWGISESVAQDDFPPHSSEGAGQRFSSFASDSSDRLAHGKGEADDKKVSFFYDVGCIFYQLSSGVSGRIPGNFCSGCAQSDRLGFLADGSSSPFAHWDSLRNFFRDQSAGF